MVFNKCCCCVDLRTGAMIIAILEILGSLSQLRRSTDLDGVIGMIVGVIAGATLMFGASKYNPTATLVHLIFSMIGVVGSFVYAILFFVGSGLVAADPNLNESINVNGNKVDADDLFEFYGLAFLFAGLLELYFWLCIYSFYKGLKSGTIKAPGNLPTHVGPGKNLCRASVS